MILNSEAPRTGCIIGDRILVLDRSTSRYLSTPFDAAAPSSIPEPHAHQHAILSWSDDRVPQKNNARVAWVTRARRAHPRDEHCSSASMVARLWLGERRISKKLRSGIGAGLDFLASIERGDPNECAIQAAIGASWQAARLWSAEDKCLARSIILAAVLRKVGSHANLVVGVTARPFAAHAWVQEDDAVLNDTLDHALLFTPILVA